MGDDDKTNKIYIVDDQTIDVWTEYANHPYILTVKATATRIILEKLISEKSDYFNDFEYIGYLQNAFEWLLLTGCIPVWRFNRTIPNIFSVPLAIYIDKEYKTQWCIVRVNSEQKYIVDDRYDVYNVHPPHHIERIVKQSGKPVGIQHIYIPNTFTFAILQQIIQTLSLLPYEVKRVKRRMMDTVVMNYTAQNSLSYDDDDEHKISKIETVTENDYEYVRVQGFTRGTVTYIPGERVQSPLLDQLWKDIRLLVFDETRTSRKQKDETISLEDQEEELEKKKPHAQFFYTYRSQYRKILRDIFKVAKKPKKIKTDKDTEIVDVPPVNKIEIPAPTTTGVSGTDTVDVVMPNHYIDTTPLTLPSQTLSEMDQLLFDQASTHNHEL